MDGKTIGLRERKRIETRSELEAATIALVIRDGLDGTTIEAISERANVSPRTFFNYFDSKEDALLGIREIEITDDIVNDHLSNYRCNDTVTRIVSLMVQLIGPSLGDPAMHTSRYTVIKQYPQLLERQMSRSIHFTKQLGQKLQTMITYGNKVTLDDAEIEVLITLCMSGVRVAIREWMQTGKLINLPSLESRAIQIINGVRRKI